MLKFRCQHCGHRMAVGSRHLSKLVTCPDCGKPTHPLAEKIVSLQDSGDAPPAKSRHEKKRPAVKPEPAGAKRPEPACANCQQPLGQLQERVEWNGHTVCAACGKRLAEDHAAREAQARGGDPDHAAVRTGIVIDPADAIAAAKLVARGAGAAGRLIAGSATAVNALGALARAAQASNDRLTPVEHGTDALLPLPRNPGLARTPAVSVRGRMILLLLVLVLAGAAVYGMLSLLKEIAGTLVSIAFVVLALGAVVVAVQGIRSVGRRALPNRGRNSGRD